MDASNARDLEMEQLNKAEPELKQKVKTLKEKENTARIKAVKASEKVDVSYKTYLQNIEKTLNAAEEANKLMSQCLQAERDYDTADQRFKQLALEKMREEQMK
ncbi:hypothetical protein PR003_g29520 [Phytophthora rubi]|nr:hypothetical protein PR002_g17397 [Phytophthora rubi]KAE9274743.1 hypothetical protein PR003_g29520 [Phytophthora rubi]